MAEFWTFVDQDFLTTDFHSSKSCFFLVSTHLRLIHCEKPTMQLFSGVLQLSPKMGFSSPNRRGQTLTKFKNILYGVY
jgi:hypothetical protein